MGSPRVALEPTMNQVLARLLGTLKGPMGKRAAFRQLDFGEGSGNMESSEGC